MPKSILYFSVIASSLILTACTTQPLSSTGANREGSTPETMLQETNRNSNRARMFETSNNQETGETQLPVSDDASLKTIEQELNDTQIVGEDLSDL